MHISGHVVLGVPSHHGRCDHPQMDQHRPNEVDIYFLVVDDGDAMHWTKI